MTDIPVDEGAALLAEIDRQLAESHGTQPITPPAPPASEAPAAEAGGVEGGEAPPPASPPSTPPPVPPETIVQDGIEIAVPPDPQEGDSLPDPDTGILPPGASPAAAPAVEPSPSAEGTAPVGDQAPLSFLDPAAPIDATAFFTEVLGRPIQRGELMEQVNLIARLQALPADAQNAIVDIMEGRQPSSPTPTAAPLPPPAPTPAAPAVDEFGDPIPVTHDPRVDALEQRLQAQQQFIDQQVQQQFSAQQQAQIADMRQGTIDFASAPPATLTAEEIAGLEVRANQSGLYPTLLQQFGGNHRAAWAEALNQMFWANPTYRQRAIAAQQTVTQQSEADTRARQVAAAAISPVSGGGAAAAAPPAPATPAERNAAAIAEAREMMARNGQQ